MASLAVNLVRMEGALDTEQRIMDNLMPTDSWFSKAARLFHAIHFLGVQWHYMDSARQSPLAFGAGFTLHVLAGDSNLVRKAAQIVLIARTFSQCSEANLQFIRATQRVKEAWHGVSPNGYVNDLMRNQNPMENNPAMVQASLSLPTAVTNFARSVQEITCAIFSALKQMYIVSDKMVELYESFTYDENTRFRAVTNVVNYGDEFVTSLQNNKNALCLALKENEVAINKVLGALNANFDAASLINSIENLEGPAQKLQTVTKAVQETFTEAVSGVVGMFTGKGLSDKKKDEPPLTIQPPLVTCMQAKELGALKFEEGEKTEWNLQKTCNASECELLDLLQTED